MNGVICHFYAVRIVLHPGEVQLVPAHASDQASLAAVVHCFTAGGSRQVMRSAVAIQATYDHLLLIAAFRHPVMLSLRC
jgi:hypothetical protein